MSGSGLTPVQKGIYTLVTAAGAFMALVTGVFDYVPDKQAYPYVTLGDATELAFRVFGNGGHEQTVTLHIWSRARGFLEAYGILDALITLIETGPLAVLNHTTVLVNFENAVSLRDPDGITRHVAAQFRIIVQDGP